MSLKGINCVAERKAVFKANKDTISRIGIRLTADANGGCGLEEPDYPKRQYNGNKLNKTNDTNHEPTEEEEKCRKMRSAGLEPACVASPLWRFRIRLIKIQNICSCNLFHRQT